MMRGPRFETHEALPAGYLDGAVARILAVQDADGAIPWFERGVFDPWNHLEAAMALNICGASDAADRAYQYLFKKQHDDGSWWGELGSAVPIDETLQTFSRQSMETGQKIRDTNFISYCALACLHYWILRRDGAFLKEAMPVVTRAINFVLSLQSEHGDIRWTAPDPQTPEDDALLAGNSAIFKSLGCAIALAEISQMECDPWREAHQRLGTALAHHPERFDRHWESKERFSMDWYYPVLSGALSIEEGNKRLEGKWDVFVEEGLGCRCVSDEPWVTTAESAELALALVAQGDMDRAREHVRWLHQFRNDQGAYWMGKQTQHNVFWPVECPPWTAGAVILAIDAVAQLTPANPIFTRDFVHAL